MPRNVNLFKARLYRHVHFETVCSVELIKCLETLDTFEILIYEQFVRIVNN